MSVTTPTMPLEDGLLPLSVASKHVGCSAPTLRGYIASGELPAYRLSTASNAPLRVRLSDVEKLLKPAVAQQPEAVAPTAATDSTWLAETMARFTPEDFRRAGELLLALSSAAQSTAA
jgi:hypothetical protein